MNNHSNTLLSRDALAKMDAYWRAANYVSVGRIYLFVNPVLRKPLKREQLKLRLVGHLGTTPGLNFTSNRTKSVSKTSARTIA